MEYNIFYYFSLLCKSYVTYLFFNAYFELIKTKGLPQYMVLTLHPISLNPASIRDIAHKFSNY